MGNKLKVFAKSKSGILRILTIAIPIVLIGLLYLQQDFTRSMSPMMQDFYQNVGSYQRISEWTLDSRETAEKYFQIGMSYQDAKKVMLEQDCQISVYPYKPKNFEENLGCFKKVKPRVFGIRLFFFNTYIMKVSLDFRDGKVARIESVINLETIYG